LKHRVEIMIVRGSQRVRGSGRKTPVRAPVKLAARKRRREKNKVSDARVRDDEPLSSAKRNSPEEGLRPDYERERGKLPTQKKGSIAEKRGDI